MKIFMFCILLLSFEYIFSETGGYCNSKRVLDDGKYDEIRKLTKYKLYDITKFYTDVHNAYHHDSSCSTLLTSGSKNDMCCYIKLKYRNLISDEKYTHYGCIEQNSTLIENDGIDGVIDELEEGFQVGMNDYMNEGKTTTADYVDKVDIHIDCSSKFLKFIAIALLSFLL